MASSSSSSSSRSSSVVLFSMDEDAALLTLFREFGTGHNSDVIAGVITKEYGNNRTADQCNRQYTRLLEAAQRASNVAMRNLDKFRPAAPPPVVPAAPTAPTGKRQKRGENEVVSSKKKGGDEGGGGDEPTFDEVENDEEETEDEENDESYLRKGITADRHQSNSVATRSSTGSTSITLNRASSDDAAYSASTDEEDGDSEWCLTCLRAGYQKEAKHTGRHNTRPEADEVDNGGDGDTEWCQTCLRAGYQRAKHPGAHKGTKP